jgi:TfoX/Sxy family transcriptional regulator of competence genes
MFGSEGLKVGTKVFAMEVKGKLVVKLTATRAAELCDAGLAEPFDPGHGRPMKQWVAVDPTARVDWLLLSREALEFVGAQYVGKRRHRRSGREAADESKR